VTVSVDYSVFNNILFTSCVRSSKTFIYSANVSDVLLLCIEAHGQDLFLRWPFQTLFFLPSNHIEQNLIMFHVTENRQVDNVGYCTYT
jgi:hypothetical protein